MDRVQSAQEGMSTESGSGNAIYLQLHGNLNDIVWNATGAGDVLMGKYGGEFTIAERLQSPTIQSRFYIFFGRVEVHMKAATGKGIVSSVVLQSEDLDEIDWEWVGSDMGHVQTNYFGKGNDTTLHWTREKLEWWIDGNLTRTLKYEDAEGGSQYPQTPSTVRLGIWPAGDKDNRQGTIDWAGGVVDYSAGPYTMIVKQVKIEDFSKGKEYVYSDKSGEWFISGISPIAKEAAKPPPKSLAQKWRELPKGAKAAIFGSIGVAAAIGMAIIAFCCVKQRAAGRKEFNTFFLHQTT